MYNQWLQVFFSPQTKIPVKGKKKDQLIEKSWVDGMMRMEGKEPSPWSVTLRPSYTVDMRKYLFDAEIGKQRAVEMMKDAFKDVNKKLFQDAEGLYQEEEKKIEDMKKRLDDYHKKRVKTAEKLFNIRRELYLLNLKRNC